MAEVMVVWEGRVPAKRLDELVAAYRDGAAHTPEAMTKHLIAQDVADPEVIRLVSFWRDAASLDEYRRNADVPAALAMFRSVDVEPTRSISQALE